MRSAAILLSAALASALVFLSVSILQSVGTTLGHVTERLGADIMVVPAGHGPKGRKILLAGEPESFYMEGRNLERVAAVPGVEKASPQLFVTSSALLCCSMPTVLLVGFDPAADFTIAPWIERTYSFKGNMDVVTVGTQVVYAQPAPRYTFYGKTFKTGSKLHQTGLAFLDYSIFMSMGAARDMIQGSRARSLKPLQIGADDISSILVKVDRSFDVEQVAREIEKVVPAIDAVTMSEVVASVRREIDTALWAALAAGAAFWALMLAATGVVFALTTNERERELGVLRAMGATRRQMLGLILSEASVLSGVGAAAGVALSVAVLATFKHLFTVAVGFPFTWQPPFHVAALAALCILLASLSGAICAALPAGRVCNKEPYEAIFHGMR